MISNPQTPPRPASDRQPTVALPLSITEEIAALSAADTRTARLEAAIREARTHLLAAEALLSAALKG